MYLCNKICRLQERRQAYMPNYACAIGHCWGQLHHISAPFLTGNVKAIQLSPTHSRIVIETFKTVLLATPFCKYLGFCRPSDFQFYPGMVQTILIPARLTLHIDDPDTEIHALSGAQLCPLHFTVWWGRHIVLHVASTRVSSQLLRQQRRVHYWRLSGKALH